MFKDVFEEVIIDYMKDNGISKLVIYRKNINGLMAFHNKIYIKNDFIFNFLNKYLTVKNHLNVEEEVEDVLRGDGLLYVKSEIAKCILKKKLVG